MAILKNTTINDTGYLQLPSGDSSQRVAGGVGETRYNSQLNIFEGYASTGWHVLSPMNLSVTSVTAGSGVTYLVGTGLQINPGISGVFTINGFNFDSATTVKLDSTAISSGVVITNPTTITVTTGTSFGPSAGTYSNIVVTNGYGQSVTYAYPVIVAGGPQFSTATNLGTVTEGTISTSVAATSPGGTISGYAGNAVSGNGGSGYGLPTGLSINSSGVITGSLVVNGTTTYNLTIKATDNSSRTASKDFTLTVSDSGIPVITSPAAGSLGILYSGYDPAYAVYSTASLPTATATANTAANAFASTQTITTFTATDPASATVYYRLSSGSLPEGIRLNSSTGVLYGSVVYGNMQPASQVFNFGVTAVDANNNASLENQYSLTVNTAYPYRQILTTGYVTGGYKSQTPWKNVNRLAMATEVTVDLGDKLTYAHNYKTGNCSKDRQYTFNSQTSGTDTAGNTILVFNMRTELGTTSGTTVYSRARSGATGGNDGYQLAAYLASGFTGTNGDSVEKYTYSTETIANLGNILGISSAGEAITTSDELYGIWNLGSVSGTAATKKITYSNDSVSSYGVSLNTSTQMKSMQTKWGIVYAGTGTGYADGDQATSDNSNMTKTILATQEQFTVSKGYSGGNNATGGGAVGEEIFVMGQDRSWAIGVYDGAQTNRGYRMIYAIDFGTVIADATFRKGTTGSSSGTGGQRD